ncbi:MAG: glycosyltransferase, partial [Deltaproteobacteria bacterium]
MPQDALSKVLLVTFDVVPDPTGSSARTTLILEGLTPYFDVDALAVKTPEHAHIERYRGARLLRVPVGTGDLRTRVEAFDRAVRRQLQSEEYEAIHFTDPYGGFAACELRPQGGYKLIYEARAFPSVELRYTDPQLESDRRFLTKIRRQEIFCLMNSDIVIATNEVTVEYIASLGVPRDRIRMVGAMVDLDTFATPKVPRGEPCRFVYLGSHASWQGLPSLLFGLRIAAQQIDLRCRIIGPTQGSWRKQLQDMVREFGLKGKVTIEPPIPHEDVPEVLAESDVGLAPLEKGDRNSTMGYAPVKIAEYLAAGRPVIATDLPIVRAMVEPNVTGLLYRPTDEEAMAECMVTLAKDPGLRARMGAEARRSAKTLFDAESHKAAFARLYQELVAPSIIVSEKAYQPPTNPGASSAEGPTVTLPAAELAASLGGAEITQTAVVPPEIGADSDDAALLEADTGVRSAPAPTRRPGAPGEQEPDTQVGLRAEAADAGAAQAPMGGTLPPVEPYDEASGVGAEMAPLLGGDDTGETGEMVPPSAAIFGETPTSAAGPDPSSTGPTTEDVLLPAPGAGTTPPERASVGPGSPDVYGPPTDETVLPPELAEEPSGEHTPAAPHAGVAEPPRPSPPPA